VGRKDVRDLILDERARGQTVFFSTHILNDAEQLCDRVCILRKGQVVLSGTLTELLSTSATRNEVALDSVDETCREALGKLGLEGKKMGEHVVYDVEGYDRVRAVIETAHANGARVASLVPKRETLEALFVRRAL
jgi:ABC-2 type transport system ATP-binding protein